MGRLILVATSAGTPLSRFLSRRWLTLEVLRGIPSPGERQPRWAWEWQRRASAAYGAIAGLGEIATPTLIVHGRRDRMTPLALAHDLHSGIAGSVLVEVARGRISLVT